jgi:predicted HAD superfamily phosphohydrolase YqeG
MHITEEFNHSTMGKQYRIAVEQEELFAFGESIKKRNIELVADQLATDILANNYNEIMSKISPEAIANMAIAEAGAAVNDTLKKKLPDKILEIEKHDTQIYQRGLLGGMTRIV